jgi:hypothetical protein
MDFTEIKDENGTTLQSYAELLTEKAKALDFTAVIVLASKERKMLHTVSTIAGSPARSILGLALSMYGLDAPQQRAVLEALENEFGGEKLASMPTTSGKPN